MGLAGTHPSGLPFFCPNGDHLTQPPPAHMGIPPYGALDAGKAAAAAGEYRSFSANRATKRVKETARRAGAEGEGELSPLEDFVNLKLVEVNLSRLSRVAIKDPRTRRSRVSHQRCTWTHFD
jgi:hypothetical protein